MVNKAELLSGIVRYVREDMIRAVPEGAAKTVIGIAATAAEVRPDYLHRIVNNIPEIKTALDMLAEEDGSYDIAAIREIAYTYAQSNGGLCLTLFGMRLKFSESDIDKMYRYIVGG